METIVTIGWFSLAPTVDFMWKSTRAYVNYNYNLGPPSYVCWFGDFMHTLVASIKNHGETGIIHQLTLRYLGGLTL